MMDALIHVKSKTTLLALRIVLVYLFVLILDNFKFH